MLRKLIESIFAIMINYINMFIMINLFLKVRYLPMFVDSSFEIGFS